MDGVAAKFAVEIFVHFEESDGNSAASEKQGQHGAPRSPANDAAGSLLNVQDRFFRGFRLTGIERRRCHGMILQEIFWIVTRLRVRANTNKLAKSYNKQGERKTPMENSGCGPTRLHWSGISTSE